MGSNELFLTAWMHRRGALSTRSVQNEMVCSGLTLLDDVPGNDDMSMKHSPGSFEVACLHILIPY